MKVGILCNLDGFANSVRATEIKTFLEKKGHKVELIDTFFISRMSQKYNRKRSFFNSLPGLNINKLRLYFLELQDFLTSKNLLKNYICSQDIIKRMNIRAEIIYKTLKKKDFGVLICENSVDSYVLTKKLNCLKIYDCPTPWADELYERGQLSNSNYLRLKEIELEIYKKTDYLSFHWETYKKYIQKYIYNGKNLFTLNWGCHPKKRRVKFNYPPKIVFLSALRMYAINEPLLSKLSKIYNVDVYGAPEPDKKWELNYKGYAHPDVLLKYQFGLVSSTKGKLRQWGFDAKHIEYISYGLPVLVPDWRKHLNLIKGSILYNKKNFLKKIEKYSNKKEWQKMSDKAYGQAKKLDWNITLKPLEKIINKYSKNTNPKK